MPVAPVVRYVVTGLTDHDRAAVEKGILRSGGRIVDRAGARALLIEAAPRAAFEIQAAFPALRIRPERTL